MIHVLIAEDSPVIAKMLEVHLGRDPDIMVVGVAKDGKEAVRMVKELKPDIVSMDLHMPVMDGYEATKQIMAYCPTPILILSSSVFHEGMEKVFEAMSYGALDLMQKTAFEGDEVDEIGKREYIDRIKLLSRIQVINHPLAKIEKHQQVFIKQKNRTDQEEAHKIIGIVASTGGPNALMNLLKDIPGNFCAPIVLVQHMSPGFIDGLVSWLDHEIPIKVKLATHGQLIEGATMYVAPTGLHMRVNASHHLELYDDAIVDGHKPSGTVLLDSIAKVYGSGAMGILLSGMGYDGVNGLKTIHEQQGYTVAQSERTCAVYGMPKAALEAGIVNEVVDIEKMAQKMIKFIEK